MASTFRTIAKYERKILMRSWFFRIFSSLALFVLFVFNMGEISEVGDMRWLYRAIPANMPYANLFLLNISQAIIAVFLSSEFIKRDRKQDTTEVFYVRSMANSTYILAKTWSILSIFLIINVAALAMGLIFNLLALNTWVDWQAYLYYPILISVPTLLFIIGLASLLMSLIRNQALTFLLLLGYILSSLIYLKGTYNYLFDYMAFYLPLFHSEIVGFSNWDTILTLRGMYASFGLGFILLSSIFLRRLPQSRLLNGLSFFLSLGFIAAALLLGNKHLTEYQDSINLPKKMIALNNEFVNHAQIDVESHDIQLKQQKDGFQAVSKLIGLTRSSAQDFVFILNPGLKINAVTENDKPLKFNRNLHLLFIQTDTIIPEGTSVNWTIEYEGTIDENACYPDVDHKVKFEKPDNNLFDIGRNYAFVHPEFMLLTPEAQWYPQPGVGYSDKTPFWYRKDFIDYQLTVKTLPGLNPVSQGQAKQIADNTFTFEREHALSQLSLSIGRYKKSSLQVEDLEFSVFYTEGHNYFESALPDIRDTIPFILKEKLGDFERQTQLKYPFKEFAIVEVPGQFKSYDRTWTSVHQTIQAGMVYLPEKGLYSRYMDFSGYEKRLKRRSRNRNKTPQELQTQVFQSFLSGFFRFKNVNTNSRGNRTEVEETINPYYQFGQFYEMCNNLDSDKWPVLNRIFESYLRIEKTTGTDWVRRSSGSTQNELANMVLQEKSFAEILTLTENLPLIDNVIELKGEMLFSIMQAKAKNDDFRSFVTQVLQENRFKNLDFEDFISTLQAKFGVDLSQDMNKWFNETEMPRYLINTPIAEKVLVGNREMTRVRFIVSNLGEAEGVIKSTLRLEEPIDKLMYLEPGQTKEAFYLSMEKPAGIHFNTLTSGNLPNQLEYTFEGINETGITNARELQVVVDNPIVIKNSGEIIVDNESSGFEFTHYEEVSRLRKWLNPEEEEGFKYKGTRVWRAPLNWTATTGDQFFGEFVRSAFYIKAGDGSKEAKWKIPVSEAGRYDVFYHVYKDDSFGWNRNQKGNYQFIIPHENGTDRPTIELSQDTPSGWTSLGDYEFASDTITITLSNESRLRAVFADAMKLVRMD